MSHETVKANDSAHMLEQAILAIYDHPFVTQETLKKREEIEQNLAECRNVASKFGITEVLAVPFGSVGAGMAIEGSDIDGMTVFNDLAQVNARNSLDAWEKIYELAQPLGLRVEPLSELLKQEVRGTAILFCPFAGEEDNAETKATINRWRTTCLNNLFSKFPDFEKVNDIWALACQKINEMVVRYEERVDGNGSADKRWVRVASVIGKKIEERFPDDAKAQARAKSFIEYSRSKFTYPSLEEVCDALGVQIPKQNS